MSRRSNPVPKYRHHKASGQAVVTVNVNGRRKDVYLGVFGSEESKSEYARVVAEFRVSTLDPTTAKKSLTVAEVLLAFRKHAERYYVRPDGTPSGEFREYGLVIRVVRQLYAHTLAADFGPLALKACRQAMEEAGLARGVINQRVGRIKRIFKWATGEELVPPHVFQGLTAVAGLRRGKTAARETEPVRPVPDAHVELVLPYLTPTVRSMVLVQRYTGMRPGELCAMRPRDILRSGETWVYRPKEHKTAHHGRERVVAIGPRAQAIIAPLVEGLAPDAHVFDPAKSVEEWYAMKRAVRKTKVQPSQANRKKSTRDRKLPAAVRFERRTYAASVASAIRRQNRDAARHDVPAGQCGPNLLQCPHWHPHQIRHTHATEVRKKFGLEAAGAALGHARMSATEVYAERDQGLAERVAAEVG